MGILIVIFTVIHVAIALALIGLVLMQKSSEQGIGAAFGAGMTDTMFGAGTTTALQKMTIGCAVALLVTTVTLAMLQAKRGGYTRESLMQKVIQTTPAPAPAPMTIPGAPPMNQPMPTSAAPTSAVPAAPATPASPAPVAAPAK